MTKKELDGTKGGTGAGKVSVACRTTYHSHNAKSQQLLGARGRRGKLKS